MTMTFANLTALICASTTDTDARRITAGVIEYTDGLGIAPSKDDQLTAAAERKAAEDREAAAAARFRAADLERQAVEAEDLAKMTPTQRATRKVARMIQTQAGGVPEKLELATIAEALGVVLSTASERRKDAAELLAQQDAAADRVTEAEALAAVEAGQGSTVRELADRTGWSVGWIHARRQELNS